MTGVTVRPATTEDADAVAEIAAESWPDRPDAEYLPAVFEHWVERSDTHTVVAERTENGSAPAEAPTVAGLAQVQLLTDEEAWAQGMRVHPAHRGAGVGRALVDELFGWARERGATVVRNMVYAWNGAGLGQSRATGFEPATQLRYAELVPTAGAAPSDHGPADASTVHDPAAVWRYWTHSEARSALSGLAPDGAEAWAVRELRREDVDAAGADGGAIAVRTPEGTIAVAVRLGVPERRGEDGQRAREAVYGGVAWDDLDAAAALLSAIAADAASVDADRTKLLVPETVRHVSDLAACRVDLHDGPEFVLAADLTGAP